MYASDMAVCYDHFDADKGTIEMARVKTAKKCKPVVYHLWSETVEAMKAHGKELATMYHRIRKMVFPTPLKQLRHTTKSFILNSQYSQFVAILTGEKGDSINEKWYWTQGQAQIKEAVAFLHSCYFPE